MTMDDIQTIGKIAAITVPTFLLGMLFAFRLAKYGYDKSYTELLKHSAANMCELQTRRLSAMNWKPLPQTEPNLRGYGAIYYAANAGPCEYGTPRVESFGTLAPVLCGTGTWSGTVATMSTAQYGIRTSSVAGVLAHPVATADSRSGS